MTIHENQHNTTGVLSLPDKHRFLARSALAGAIALALAATYMVTTNEAAANLPQAQPSTRSAFAGPPSFAEVAQRVTPAVVNVAVTPNDGSGQGHPRVALPQIPKDSPMHDFFERFFDGRSGMPEGFEVPRQVQGQGSGFIIDEEGHVVTNNHVIAQDAEVQVILNDGSKYQARVKGRDPKTDLALLKIDADQPLPYVELGDSDGARVGDWVLAVGNPFGLGGSVSAGIVSARGRDINSGPYDDYLQIDAPINRGNSGGPLFDASGQVVGVNTAIYSPSGGNVGIGFAIPSSTAEAVIAQLKERGQVERGWLGVQIQAVTDDVAASLNLQSSRGALVASSVPDSPASEAGLRPGDLILSVGGTTIDDFKTLPRMIADTNAGTRLMIEVLRNGKTEQIPVVIGAMPTQKTMAAAADEYKPRLGLYLSPLTPQSRKTHGIDGEAKGVLVAEVESGSPAQKAGIKPGNLISMIGQQQVTAPEEVVAGVRKATEEKRESVLLLVEQDGEKRFVAVPFQT